jgi:hypothetical protein
MNGVPLLGVLGLLPWLQCRMHYDPARGENGIPHSVNTCTMSPKVVVWTSQDLRANGAIAPLIVPIPSPPCPLL